MPYACTTRARSFLHSDCAQIHYALTEEIMEEEQQEATQTDEGTGGQDSSSGQGTAGRQGEGARMEKSRRKERGKQVECREST